MKILIIEGDIFNSISGFRKDLVVELKKKHEVFIAGSIAYEWQQKKILEKSSKYIVLGKLKSNPLFYIKYFFKLNYVIFTIKPDLCLSFNLRPNLFLGIIKLFKNVPSVATITGTGILFERMGFKLGLLRTIYKLSLSKFNCIFIQNESDLYTFINFGFNFRDFRLISGSGVNTEIYKPDSLNNVKKDETKFLFLARLVKEKGFFEYIQSAKNIKKIYSNVEFLVIGSFYEGGNSDGRIEENLVKTLHEQGVINYLGAQDNVIPFIKSVDCIVLPSYREGLSNTLMEGASLAKPIITCDVPGCRELVDNNISGYLCKPKDSEDLTSKLKDFINLPLEMRKNMGIEGRKKMIKSFNRSEVISEYFKIIDHITKIV